MVLAGKTHREPVVEAGLSPVRHKTWDDWRRFGWIWRGVVWVFQTGDGWWADEWCAVVLVPPLPRPAEDRPPTPVKGQPAVQARPQLEP